MNTKKHCKTFARTCHEHAYEHVVDGEDFGLDAVEPDEGGQRKHEGGEGCGPGHGGHEAGGDEAVGLVRLLQLVFELVGRGVGAHVSADAGEGVVRVEAHAEYCEVEEGGGYDAADGGEKVYPPSDGSVRDVGEEPPDHGE